MKRRIFLVLLPLIARASRPTWMIGNAFAKQYHDWGVLRNARVDDPLRVATISVPEIRQWQKTKAAWRELENQVEAEYRGER